MERLLQDLRFAGRTLIRKPAFTAITVLTLALGIGANCAIFSVVHGVLLNPLAYPDSERLVAVFETKNEQLRGSTSPANFLDWREQCTSLQQMTAASVWSPTLTGRDRPEQLRGIVATSDLFELLGSKPLLGTVFTPRHGTEAEKRVVVLGYSLWQRRFGGDSRILGQSLMLDGEPYTVLGIMPQGFRFPPFWASDAEIWTPLVFAAQAGPRTQLSVVTNRGGRYLRVFARLAPSVSREQAQAEMENIVGRLEEAYPANNAGVGINVEALQEPVVGDVRPALLVLLGTVVFVLLIGCANVANLLLSRAADREKEIATRRALGADRGRLVRQLLTESVLLALVGGGAGLLLSQLGVMALRTLSPRNLPRLEEIAVDGNVLGFTLAVSLLTGLFFGLAPALRATGASLSETLKEGGRRSRTSRARLTPLLVVGEVALALILLVGAGLFLNSFRNMIRVDPGFRTEDLVAMRISLTGSRFEQPERQDQFFREAVERIEAIPGIRAAGFVNILHIGGDTWGVSVTPEGQAAAGGDGALGASIRVATPRLFTAMGIPLLLGRSFTLQDTADSQAVVIVNKTLADLAWPGENPIGKRIKRGPAAANTPWMTVVGVAGGVHQDTLTDPVKPEVYFPYTQNPVAWYANTTLLVHTAGTTPGLIDAVQQAVWSLDRNVPMADVRTVDQVLSETLARARLQALLLGLFAAVALLLAAVGLYGVISYSVSRRTHEIGIRMALGARRADILRLVVGRGMLLAGSGLLLGVAGAVLLTRWMGSLLFEISATDPRTFAGVSLLLAIVACLACYLPARRASGVDPSEALRYE